MEAEWNRRKSRQIPAFGDWDNANQLQITQYFECVNNNAAAPHRPKTSGLNKGSHHSKEQRKLAKVRSLMDQPVYQHPTQKQYPKPRNKIRNLQPVHEHPTHKQYPKPRNKIRNLHPSSVTVKPVDEDLYKIPPELLQKPKRKNILGFFSRCILSPCAG